MRKHPVEILVEANLYGGNFRCQMTQKSYQTNLAGEMAMTDIRLTPTCNEEPTNFLIGGSLEVKQWDRLPVVQNFIDPYYLEIDVPKLSLRSLDYDDNLEDTKEFLKELAKLDK